VIQGHHARSHHFDFRFEKEGAFKSWSVPNGVPTTDSEKHLAVEVEGHPLSFGDFEGTIPAGQYGAGTSHIWDSGSYEASEWSENRIVFPLFRKRTHGEFKMLRFFNPNTTKWLMMRASSQRMNDQQPG
jgi:bifunctional non-homologous end joining protein LigD